MTDDRHRIAARAIAKALGHHPDDPGTQRLAEALATTATIDHLATLLYAAALELDPDADGEQRRAALSAAGIVGPQPTRQLLSAIYTALQRLPGSSS
jgi:hypothetical protein